VRRYQELVAQLRYNKEIRKSAKEYKI
jgi:hypothetical protein